MLSMGFCTTRHWQTSDRLVQELNVCTVAFEIKYLESTKHTYYRKMLMNEILNSFVMCFIGYIELIQRVSIYMK